MVAWYWIIVAFIGGLVFATVSWNAVEWETALTNILAGIAIPFVYIGMFPVSFFRLFVKPLSVERWVEFTSKNPADKYRKIGKNTYFWHDANTKKLFNKFFLVRVKPIDKKE